MKNNIKKALSTSQIDACNAYVSTAEVSTYLLAQYYYIQSKKPVL